MHPLALTSPAHITRLPLYCPRCEGLLSPCSESLINEGILRLVCSFCPAAYAVATVTTFRLIEVQTDPTRDIG
jgi:hypothetical protein